MFKQILAHLMAPIYFDYQNQFSPRDFKMIIKKNTCRIFQWK